MSGWSNYSEDEKRSIIDSLPPNYREYEIDDKGSLICPLTLDFVLGDRYLQSAITKFKREVTDGFYEKRWQNQAKQAMQERREGKFDDYLKEHVEEMFGEEKDGDGDDVDKADEDELAFSSDGEWKDKEDKRTRKTAQGTK